MDSIDFKILKILQTKARIPNVEVARKIGMAPSAVLERIKKLESKNIISAYEVRLNPERFNRSMIVFIHIYIKNTSQISEIGKQLSKMEEIQEVHYIAGEDCLMAKIRVSDTKELENIISNKIASIKTVQSTKTFIALSTYKESARIPLTGTSEENNYANVQ